MVFSKCAKSNSRRLRLLDWSIIYSSLLFGWVSPYGFQMELQEDVEVILCCSSWPPFHKYLLLRCISF